MVVKTIKGEEVNLGYYLAMQTGSWTGRQVEWTTVLTDKI